MKSFGYCIWLVPCVTKKLINITNGFTPHITVRSHLRKNQAIEEFKRLSITKPIKIKLDKDYKLSEEDNFFALYYNVKPINYTPIWWPENAHISFRYKYDKPFTKEVVEQAINHKFNYLYFENLEIRNCNGHFKNWEKISKNDI